MARTSKRTDVSSRDGADVRDFANDIVQTMREPLLVLDADLRIKLANRAFYQTFKVPPGKPIGRLIYELGDGQWNIPALRKLLDDLLPTNGEFNDYQVEHDFPDIGHRTMLLNARRLHDGNNKTKLILLAIHDITERRKAEELLQISEIRYRRLFEAAHDGILILDAKDRKITDVNPFILDLLDYPREHFIGKELWQIGVFHDKDESQAAMRELHGKGTIRFENKPLQDRNGRRHPVEIVANIYQEDHQPVIQCNIRDISERTGFERERAALLANEQASRLEAEAANRTKDVFLATLSHELRTPLSAILGWAVMLREGCSPAEIKEAAETIERSARAQAELIDDVLDVARIVSGKLRLEMSRAELKTVIEAAVAAVRPVADAKRIQIDVAIDPAASPTSCDSSRMQQVVWNLLTNAIKFTPDGGAIQVSLIRRGSMAQIAVSDNGAGISAESVSHVFERFWQVETGTRRKHGGLGLGLSIVRNIVEMHGGTVEAKSEGLGRGSTFVVKLPVQAVAAREQGEVESPHAEAVPANMEVRLDGLRLLVVDDEADARRLLKTVLERAGAVVSTAGSTAEAIKLLAKVHPHLLVSDIAMPDRDGYDLMREVRSAGHHARELPAVALTAFASQQDRRSALLAGFQMHLAKPVDPHELTAAVASLAGRTGKG